MASDEPPYDANNPLWRGGQPCAEPDNLTDAFTREAEDFIVRHRGQPWFLYLAYNAVHSPMQASVEWFERHADIADPHRRLFAAMLGHLDHSIGRLLDLLERKGLADRTLVMVVSDNGGPTRELTSSNRPFRGGKGEMYEGGIRVPMWVKWPGVATPGTVERRVVSTLDWTPTALDAAGVSVPEGLDGFSLLPYFRDEHAEPRRSRLFWRCQGQAAVREGRRKLIRPRPDAPWELYDLERDPSEMDDMAGRERGTAGRLTAAWSEWARGLPTPAGSAGAMGGEP